MTTTSPFSSSRFDRIIILSAVLLLTALSWVWLIHDVTSGTDSLPACCARPDPRLWKFPDLFALFIMWTIMMVGMMAPTVVPVLLLFDGLTRQRRSEGRAAVSTLLFLLGYLLAWTLFSLVATLCQWGLHRTAMLSRGMVSANHWFAATVLIAAGVFQLMPFKRACLTHCRSPLDFILTQWREGRWGAISMGLRHGISCTGCCWLLMAILFVVGVMNLVWVAVITLFVLAEKTLPWNRWVARATASCLIVWGVNNLS